MCERGASHTYPLYCKLYECLICTGCGIIDLNSGLWYWWMMKFIGLQLFWIPKFEQWSKWILEMEHWERGERGWIGQVLGFESGVI